MEAYLVSLLHKMPKIEVHTHIGGSLRASTFRSLSVSKNISTSHIQFSDVSIQKGFEMFQVIAKLIDCCEVLHRITREII
jgi:adenosine deaminase